jgi:cbb3-type cytochrome oxidase subunit 3
MNFNLPYITIGAFVAIIIFAYMRNRQADRNDRRRERLEEKQEELLDLLRKNNSEKENTDTNDN